MQVSKSLCHIPDYKCHRDLRESLGEVGVQQVPDGSRAQPWRDQDDRGSIHEGGMQGEEVAVAEAAEETNFTLERRFQVCQAF